METPTKLSAHIYSFYKELFAAGPRSGVSLSRDLWPVGVRVSDRENEDLTLPFSSEEVFLAIKGMKANSAPGPDGLPVVFFQRFWETLRPVIMAMFQAFYVGTLVMSRLMFCTIHVIKGKLNANQSTF